MIQDLDQTIREMLSAGAEVGSELEGAAVEFDIPDSTWRAGLDRLTVNCYLYSVQENKELRRNEPIVHRNIAGNRATRLRPPVRIDCAYCITAWSTAAANPVFEEHRLLSQVLGVLLRTPTIPAGLLQGSLVDQIPPYPTVIASTDGPKNEPEFWGALDQRLRPSLNYVVTLAYMLDEVPEEADMTPVVEEVEVEVHHMEEAP
jgi:hypothetical protein